MTLITTMSHFNYILDSLSDLCQLFFWNNREEKKTKSVENDLIGELRDILKGSRRESFNEIPSPTWTVIRARGIPDRFEPKLRKALSEAFVFFDDYNYKVRQYNEYRLADSGDPKLGDLEYHVRVANKKLGDSAERVIDMVDS